VQQTVAGADLGAEAADLWAQLERLKLGIGGWVVTAAAMPTGTAEADAEHVDADEHIRDLTDRALAVRARLREITPARGLRRPVQGLPALLPAQMRPPGATPPRGAPVVVAPAEGAGERPPLPRRVPGTHGPPSHRAPGPPDERS